MFDPFLSFSNLLSMKKNIFLLLFFLFSFLLSANEKFYTNSASDFTLNPTYRVHSLSFESMLIDAQNNISSHKVAVIDTISAFGYGFAIDYFYFKYYKDIHLTSNASYFFKNFIVGGNFIYGEDSFNDKTYTTLLSVTYKIKKSSLLFCIEPKIPLLWSLEAKLNKNISFKIEKEDFLLSTNVRILKNLSLLIGCKTSTINTAISFKREKYCFLFSVQWHTHIEEYYRLIVGVDF